MGEFFDWVATSPWGVAVVIGGLMLLFGIVAVLYELRTRAIYPDRNKKKRKK